MFKDDFLQIINREQRLNRLSARQLEILFNKWQGWLTHLKTGRISYVRIDKGLENGLKALGLKVALIPIEGGYQEPPRYETDDFMKQWERACRRFRRLKKGEAR